MPKTHRLRLVLLAALSMATFALIELRLAELQLIRHENYASRADHQQHRTEILPPVRGSIFDSQGTLLAASHFSKSIILDTTRRLDEPDPVLVLDLARALSVPADRVQAWFDNPLRRHVARKASEPVVQSVQMIAESFALPKGMIVLEDASKRVHPDGRLASHIMGFTSIDEFGSDNLGLAGIEKQYNDALSGERREVRLPVSSGLKRRSLTETEEAELQATFGHDLVLTIDHRIQTIAQNALARGVAQFQALGGIALVMDVATGEILAYVNLPDFDTNADRPAPDSPQMKNRILTDPIEVGSVMKIITASLLLDHGLVRYDDLVDCKHGVTYIAGRRISDTHDSGVVPFHEAFAESSNVAMASLTDSRLDSKIYHDSLVAFGLGARTGIDLPGEGAGIMYPLEKWTAMSKASLAIGYEIGLTPLQVISALGAIGNNGWRMRPHLVREIRNSQGQLVRAIRPEPLGQPIGRATCKVMLKLLNDVVTSGTAKREGQVPGYDVGGKTGTTMKTQKDNEGKTRYIASFAGLAPIDNPKLAVYVYIDEPHGAKYGGDVAAPVFRNICEQSLPLLGIAPVRLEEWQAGQTAREQATPRTLLAAVRTAVAAAQPVPALPAVELPFTAFRPVLPGLAPALPRADGARMPDLRGMTMIEAWDKLGRLGIEARMRGSGVAVSQEPPAGAPLEAGRLPEVLFSHQSDAAAPVGDTAGLVSADPLQSALASASR